MRPILLALGCVSTLAGCRPPVPANVAGTTNIPAGKFVMGSSLDERAYALEVAYSGHGGVHPDAISWIRREFDHTEVELAAYRIMTRPVTNADYLIYVRETGSAEPYVAPEAWTETGAGHSYSLILPFLWKEGTPSADRLTHPVVLVGQKEAAAYCKWWGNQRAGIGVLPSEAQWEKAARGVDGRYYPWGDGYDRLRLNALDSGPGTTVPVGLYPEAQSPYGVQDVAGNVFEWTSTGDRPGEYVVKGGAWSTDGGIARPAARHARPESLRHVAVGFRCVLIDPKTLTAKAKAGAKKRGHGRANAR